MAIPTNWLWWIALPVIAFATFAAAFNLLMWCSTKHPRGWWSPPFAAVGAFTIIWLGFIAASWVLERAY